MRTPAPTAQSTTIARGSVPIPLRAQTVPAALQVPERPCYAKQATTASLAAHLWRYRCAQRGATALSAPLLLSRATTQLERSAQRARSVLPTLRSRPTAVWQGSSSATVGAIHARPASSARGRQPKGSLLTSKDRPCFLHIDQMQSPERKEATSALLVTTALQGPPSRLNAQQADTGSPSRVQLKTTVSCAPTPPSTERQRSPPAQVAGEERQAAMTVLHAHASVPSGRGESRHSSACVNRATRSRTPPRPHRLPQRTWTACRSSTPVAQLASIVTTRLTRAWPTRPVLRRPCVKGVERQTATMTPT